MGSVEVQVKRFLGDVVLRGMFYLVVVLGIEWCKSIPRFCIRVPVVYVRSGERLWELSSLCH